MARLCHRGRCIDGEVYLYGGGGVYLGSPAETFNQFLANDIKQFERRVEVEELWKRTQRTAT